MIGADGLVLMPRESASQAATSSSGVEPDILRLAGPHHGSAISLPPAKSPPLQSYLHPLKAS